MRTVLTALVLLVTALSTAFAAPGSTIYYSDATKNVCRATVDAAGKAIGKPQKLTTTGGFDAFSVSPDEKRVVGFAITGQKLDPDSGSTLVTWKCFTEEPAKKNSRRIIKTFAPQTSAPTVLWSPKSGYFTVLYGLVDPKTDVYQFATGKPIITGSAMPACISPDEKQVILEIRHELRPSGTGVLDLKTAQSAAARAASVEISPNLCPAVWVGSEPKVAFIDGGSLYVSDIKNDGPGISSLEPRRISSASYDLKYIDGKGVYFIMGSFRSNELPCYSADLANVTEGTRLPAPPDRWQACAAVKQKKKVLPDEALYSPNGEMIACTVPSADGKTKQIYVMDSSGRWTLLAAGKSPRWKGDNLWSPWESLW